MIFLVKLRYRNERSIAVTKHLVPPLPECGVTDGGGRTQARAARRLCS